MEGIIPPGEPGPFCCGVCQFEGRYCGEMAPPGAVRDMVDMYRRDFGFDFDAFTPAELYKRIEGDSLDIPELNAVKHAHRNQIFLVLDSA